VPDVGAMLPGVINLWFWMTPVVWPLSNIPEEWRWAAFLNPMTIIVEGYRYALTGAPILIGRFGLVLLSSAVLFVWAVSLLAFRRMRSAFADAL
jgi:lipopolysaccharide transport system permease protein